MDRNLFNILQAVKTRRYFKKNLKECVKYGSIVALFASTSGCALFNQEGFEMYAKAGVRAVDEHEEKQSTKLKPCGGLRGWWNGCDSEETQATK